MRNALSVAALLAIAIAIAALAPRASFADIGSSGYRILSPTLSSGGGYSSSASYTILSTIGEFAHDLGSSASFGSRPGFPGYPFVSTPAVSATGGDTVDYVSWTPSEAFLGYTVSGYTVGQSLSASGPFSYTAVGNTLAYTASGLTNGTPYYFLIRALDQSGNVIATSTVTVATPNGTTGTGGNTGGGNTGGGGRGGGGGGGAGGGNSPSGSGSAIVDISGRAYPGSQVVLLKDGQVALSSVAGGDALFSFELRGLAAGRYTFSVYAIDSKGIQSNALPISAKLMDGSTATVSGLFLSPTISVDKAEVKRGDNVTIFGQAAASSSVVISVHSNPEYFVNAPTDKNGGYLYIFDSSQLDFGDHLAKSKAMLSEMGMASTFSGTVGFSVGGNNQAAGGTCGAGSNIGDLNCDGKVNLVDFSIMAYWYGRPLTGTGLSNDLNHDGVVNLVDFSIMLYHWTG